MMSYFWRAATMTWLSTYWCVAMLCRAIVLALAMLGLAVYLALDFIPKRKSKPLTSQTPPTPKLPHLYRPRGSSDIFAEFSDGTVIQLEPMQAKLYAEACFEAVAGAFVYEKTKLPDR